MDFAFISERIIYVPIIFLMMTGLYIIVATGNLVKRLVGLSIFQTSIGFLYIALGKVFGGAPPIYDAHHGDSYGDDHGDGYGETASHGAEYAEAGHAAEGLAEDAAEHAADYADHAADAADAAYHAVEVSYSNPLPHVLILTAIVVGVATLAVGLALVVRIREAYGTIEDDALNAADYSTETGGSA
jgi:multicomponent Na+:H+ antiporter subunit C